MYSQQYNFHPDLATKTLEAMNNSQNSSTQNIQVDQQPTIEGAYGSEKPPLHVGTVIPPATESTQATHRMSGEDTASKPGDENSLEKIQRQKQAQEPVHPLKFQTRKIDPRPMTPMIYNGQGAASGTYVVNSALTVQTNEQIKNKIHNRNQSANPGKRGDRQKENFIRTQTDTFRKINQ